MVFCQKLQQIVTELFIRIRKLNISLVIFKQSFFSVPKISLDIEFENVMTLRKKSTAKRYFLENNTTLHWRTLCFFLDVTFLEKKYKT